MTDIAEGSESILAYWFRDVGAERWWVRSEQTDREIGARFRALWTDWHTRPSGDFLGGPRMALAATLLFDQFPRNMFRGQPEAYATDRLALTIAGEAIDRNYDAELDEGERSFLYMPFMHSEDLADQDRSVDMFARLGLEEPFRYAQLHRDMILRDGRFPARNAALGRETLPGEEAGIAESRDW